MRASFGARVLLVLTACLALVVATGCAAQNRETFMRDRASEYIYQRPMPEVWAAAKALLAEDGYSGREEKGSWVYITEWKQEGGDSSVGARFTRYLIEGKELSPTQSMVRFVVMSRVTGSNAAGLGNTEPSTHSGMGQLGGGKEVTESTQMPTNTQEAIGPKAALASGKRDLDMEWRLLQKVEPTKAKQIEDQAYREYP